MDGILYVPYVNTDLEDNSFNYNGSSLDYIGQLNNVGSNLIGKDGFGDYLNHKPNNAIGFNASINQPKEYYSDQISFYELPCNFMNDDGVDETIDNLLNHYNMKDSFMMIISFDHENTDEDCLVELKSWVAESKKVMNMPDDVYSEEIKMSLLPRRQFKIKTGIANAFLNKCMFYDNYDDKIVIFVEEIIFYN